MTVCLGFFVCLVFFLFCCCFVFFVLLMLIKKKEGVETKGRQTLLYCCCHAIVIFTRWPVIWKWGAKEYLRLFFILVVLTCICIYSIYMYTHICIHCISIYVSTSCWHYWSPKKNPSYARLKLTWFLTLMCCFMSVNILSHTGHFQNQKFKGFHLDFLNLLNTLFQEALQIYGLQHYWMRPMSKK